MQALPIVQNGRFLLKMGELTSISLTAEEKHTKKDELIAKLKNVFQKTKILHFILFNDFMLVANKKK